LGQRSERVGYKDAKRILIKPSIITGTFNFDIRSFAGSSDGTSSIRGQHYEMFAD